MADVLNEISNMKMVVTVFPGGMTLVVQTLDISVNKRSKTGLDNCEMRGWLPKTCSLRSLVNKKSKYSNYYFDLYFVTLKPI